MALTVLALAQPAARAGVEDGPQGVTSPLQVALRIGGEQVYRFGGEGVCEHADEGSVYDSPAALWSVRQSEPVRNINLAFWRVHGGADMFALSLSLAGTSYRVSTVRVGDKGELEGSGRVTLTASGHGGTFSIDAVAAGGATVTGTVSCGRFTPVVGQGGGE